MASCRCKKRGFVPLPGFSNVRTRTAVQLLDHLRHLEQAFHRSDAFRSSFAVAVQPDRMQPGSGCALIIPGERESPI